MILFLSQQVHELQLNLKRQKVTLTDNSQDLDLTLWGEQADVSYPVGTQLKVTAGQTAMFDNKITVGTTQTSVIEVIIYIMWGTFMTKITV